MAICANCGVNMPDGLQFCNNCGAPLPVAPAQQPAGGYRRSQQRYGQQPQQPQQQQGYAPQQPHQPQQQGYAPQQYSAPQQQNYGTQPTFGAPQGYGAQANPRAGIADFGKKVKGFGNKYKAAPGKPVNSGLLRIVSLIFAVGMLLLSIGIATGIYSNRCYDESGYGSASTNSKRIAASYLTAGTNVEAIRNIARQEAKLQAKHSYTTVEKDRYTETKNNEEAKKALKTELDAVKEHFGGFNWFMMQLGLRSGVFIWLGAIIAILSGAAWWFMGGRIATLRQNAVMPALYGVCVFFVLMLFFCLVLAPVYFSRYINNIDGLASQYLYSYN